MDELKDLIEKVESGEASPEELQEAFDSLPENVRNKLDFSPDHFRGGEQEHQGLLLPKSVDTTPRPPPKVGFVVYESKGYAPQFKTEVVFPEATPRIREAVKQWGT